jgi:putative ABC transport system permease protein
MPDPRESRARRWFRRALALLPFDTQREYGREMEDVFMLEHRDQAATGPRALGRLWAGTLGGVLAFARREQFAATRDDLRQAVRGWRRSPVLFGVLVATMCAGIAGVTIAFAVVDAVLVRPLPVPDPATLVRVSERHPDADALSNVTYATFLDVEAGATALDHVAACRWWWANLTGEGTPERLLAAQVSGAFFDAVGVTPRLGRLLTPDDDRAGHDDVVVISTGLWRRRFGAAESIVGRRVQLNGQLVQVVGVLPSGAEFPLGTDVWSPLVARDSDLRVNRTFHGLQVLARLARDAEAGRAQAEIDGIAGAINREFPDADPNLALRIEPVLDRVVAPVRAALWTAMAATVLLLVVLGANVAHVQLARAAGREREFALRAALGASRGRIARLLLTESLALSLVAGSLGLLVAWSAVHNLSAWLPASLPRAEDIVFDWRAAVVGLAVAVAIGLGFGLGPAMRSAGTGGRRGRRLTWGAPDPSPGRAPGRLLAAGQLGLTFALVVVAGLIVRSAIASARMPLGFAADDLVRVDMSLTSGRVADPSNGDAYVAVLDPLLRRLEAIPGVTGTGLSTTAPLAGGAATSFVVVGDPAPAGREPLADIRIVDAGLFEVLDVPLLAGRTFTADDQAASRPVMVVSETLARRHFPDGRAVGRSITMLNWGPPRTAEVIGVVGDVVGQDLEATVNPTIYWHYPQFPQLFALTLFVRSDRDAGSIVPEVRQAIWELEPSQPLPRIEPMALSVAGARAQRRTLTVLLVGLAAAAAVFALVGLYGVLSHQAARETSAHGVRIALGARPSDIARMVVGDAARLAAVGIAIGVALALAGGRTVESLLFQTSARDAAVFAVAGVLLLAAALAAALAPAWRASHVDPLVALRQE